MNKGLYIHVPFCRQKCIYCDFYSGKADEDTKERYTEAVIRNIKNCGYSFDTVYFGGGTPSLLAPDRIYSILSAADISGDAEISMEANPETVTENSLSGYKSAGINRLSFGVQSFDDNELRMLGRIHNAQTAADAVSTAGRYFDNISVDIMLGLPFSDGKTVLSGIEKALSLPVRHISAYMLKIEGGTPLSQRDDLKKGIDDDRSAEQYEAAVDILTRNGLYQYEISNFAVKGYECRHNLKYWHCEEYLGIGPAAHSCIDGKRFYVPSDTEDFIRSDIQKTVYSDENACTEKEHFMLAMRLNEGYKGSKQLTEASRIYEKAGLMTIDNDRIAFTVQGMLVSNELITRLSDFI